MRTGGLTYEDLVAAPAAAMAPRPSGLGIASAPADLPHVTGSTARLAPSHGLSGNPGRFEHGDIALRVDDSGDRRCRRASGGW